MPNMVMSHPPKSTGNNMRKKKNKNDHIVPISYMYVGTPKKKFTFYVRERLVYRANVEVTYDEVYNYLASTTGDDTVSLHYSVNGQYIPITTTGQLHTFIRLIHNDPNAFLYVENHDYVWNVTPQSKGHKMEKRNPNGGAATPPQDDDLEVEDEDIVPLSGEEEDPEGSQVDDEDVEDEDESEAAEESEEAPPVKENFTCPKAEVVEPGRVALKDSFVEPILPAARALPAKKAAQGPPPKPKTPSSEPAASDPGQIDKKPLTEGEAYDLMKSIVSGALKDHDVNKAARRVAQQIVNEVWSSSQPRNEKVFNDTVDLLQPCMGTGLMSYLDHIVKKLNKETAAERKAKGPLDAAIGGDNTPAHNPTFLVEFLESATVAACDMLESVQHLAKLQQEFDYFAKLNENLVEDEKNKTDTMPTNEMLSEHMLNAVQSTHYGFNILEPVFPDGCACKEAVRTLLVELEKMNSILTNVLSKTTAVQTIKETKQFVIETLEQIIGRYTGAKCTMHESVKAAITDAESFKWRNDTTLGFEQWNQLRQRGENRLNIPQKVRSTQLDLPEPFAIKPTEKTRNPADMPIADLGCLANSTPLTIPLISDAQPTPPLPNAVTYLQPLNDTRPGNTSSAISTEQHPSALQNPNVAPPPKAPEKVPDQNAASASDATTTATGAAAGGGTAVVSKTMSAELRKMIDNMYKTMPTQHNHVYPTPPKAGSILIPTGGLARCRCSKNCTELLMEPAYEYVERFNEPRQTVWEKTKQKRFKKN